MYQTPDNKIQASNDPNSSIDYGGLGDLQIAFGNKLETQIVVFSWVMYQIC